MRTCFDTYGVWKAKYAKAGSPFKALIKGTQKEAAIIDREVWVFGVDATSGNDIVISVQIAMAYFKTRASSILGDVYVKNMNAEGESDMARQALVNANKQLYTRTTKAIIDAAKVLGCSNELKLWVFSNNVNHKIPQKELHSALRDGGADSVETDTAPHSFKVGPNSGRPGQVFKTHLHLARIAM